MKKNYLSSYIIILLSFFFTNAFSNPSDTSAINIFEDTLEVDLVLTDSIESNFDANLDSMMDLYYIDTTGSVGTFKATAGDMELLPDFPDSVYIERLASIPTTVKLSYNDIVKRYIDVYAKKKKSSVEVMLGLSEHYFPIFDDIFDYYGVPNEMKYMSIIESALNPRAYSRTRAVGLWQFMYGTGRIYGLEINSLVDERADPIKATHAAAAYVKDLYDIYHDWILVIAAYNCGPGNVNRAIRRAGGKTNYWDIYYYLPRETRGHIPAFIAATYIMNFYKEHNLIPAQVDFPIYADTIMISEPLHLQQVSEVLNIPIQEIRDLNPQYRCDIIPGGKKQYPLLLPVENTLDFIDSADVIYAYKDSIFFDPQRIKVTQHTHSSAGFIPEAPGADYVKITYTVKSGDNIGFISEWFDVRTNDIRYWNNIRRNTIRAGQKLAIYKHKGKAEKYRKIDNMSFAEKQAFVGKSVLTQQVIETSQLNIANDFVIYTVRTGDTLWEIAQKFPGVSDRDIMRLNNLSNASKLKPGQQLKIKPKN
jgi:membrane-bound lytic murein transglycosylase D